jgi:SAM-dependent methyltransferase
MNQTINFLPRMYTSNAAWFHALTAPEDYAEEAEIYRQQLLAASRIPVKEVLELGSGGGNNASHLKQHFHLTLVDLSPDMLAISGALNPECEHLQGDMRTVRLDRQFDAVFIHDAVMYLTTLDDLRQAMETAYLHCKSGGVALFVPDCVKETFRPSTDHGGHDREGYSMRYLEWNWDPDPDDSTYNAEFAYLLRQPDGTVRCEYDRHILGLFPRADWMNNLEKIGFEVRTVPFVHSEVEPGTVEIFIGVKSTS